MLFTRSFWNTLWQIQIYRFSSIFRHRSKIQKCFLFPVAPLVLVLSFLECLLSIVFYAIPYLGFILVTVRGIVKRLLDYKLSNLIFQIPAVVITETTVVVLLYLFFQYSICLMFIESFSFVAKIVVFCLIAVILYPSLSFGYLFYLIVLLYYFLRHFRNFGNGYLELLSTAVEHSVDLETNVNSVNIVSNEIVLSNVKVYPITGIRINNIRINVPENNLQSLQHDVQMSAKVKQHQNTYGIPKELFIALVNKYRPIHIQFI